MLEKKILNISKIENTDKYDRKKVGYLSGIIGTFLNVTLGVSKFVIGILANSVSITADAVNNFSDAIYSFEALNFLLYHRIRIILTVMEELNI